MKKILPLLAITMAFLMFGCSSMTKEDAFPNMYEEKPVSILVIPTINNSTAADVPELYSSTINAPLSNAGFYVLPMELTDAFLRNEGLTEGSQIRDIPPQRFAETFGADAVFYATIEKWDTLYIILGGSVAVDIRFELKSCKTGESLWSINRSLVVDTSANTGEIISTLVLTALQTAAQDYVPIAKQVNLMALETIPFGKYHNQHDLDRENIVVFHGEDLLEAEE